MDVAQITGALESVFNDEHVRVVFWNDPDGEFIESLPVIALEGVEVLDLDSVGALEAKVRIELDDPTGRYLLYAPAEEPDYENDWLLDMRLYSRSFPGRPCLDHSAGAWPRSPAPPAAPCEAPQVF